MYQRYLDGVFDVFAINNGLSYIGADLTYLNFMVAVTGLEVSQISLERY